MMIKYGLIFLLIILLVSVSPLVADDYNSCIAQGNAAVGADKLAEALRWYKKAYAQQESKGLAKSIASIKYNLQVEMALAAHNSGDYEGALGRFIKAYEINQADKNLPGRILRLCDILGRARHNAGDYQGASEFFNTALGYDQGHWQAWRGKASCFYYLKDYRKALENIARACRLLPDDRGLAGFRELIRWRLGAGGQQERFREYKALNDSEQRLLDFKDNDEMLWLKLAQLDYINGSRSLNGAASVRLDILAGRVANAMCKEAAENRFVGHWNLRGEKPYHRWAFAGGMDHIAENGSMREITPAPDMAENSARIFRSPDSYLRTMAVLHDGFMAERPPHDGHRKNCIDQYHTRVGIGCSLYENQFRYYEEFIDRYLEFVGVRSEAAVGETVSFAVKPKDKSKHLFMVVVYREPWPRSLTPQQASRMGKGKLRGYDDFSDEVTLKFSPWQLARGENGEYAFAVKFSQQGLYYIKIYLSERQYRADERGTTEGKVEASGIVVRVE